MPARRKETGMETWRGRSRNESNKHCMTDSCLDGCLQTSLWDVNLARKSEHSVCVCVCERETGRDLKSKIHFVDYLLTVFFVIFFCFIYYFNTFLNFREFPAMHFRNNTVSIMSGTALTPSYRLAPHAESSFV